MQGRGKLPEAIAEYEKALGIDPDHELVRRTLDAVLAPQRRGRPCEGQVEMYSGAAIQSGIAA